MLYLKNTGFCIPAMNKEKTKSVISLTKKKSSPESFRIYC